MSLPTSKDDSTFPDDKGKKISERPYIEVICANGHKFKTRARTKAKCTFPSCNKIVNVNSKKQKQALESKSENLPEYENFEVEVIYPSNSIKKIDFIKEHLITSDSKVLKKDSNYQVPEYHANEMKDIIDLVNVGLNNYEVPPVSEEEVNTIFTSINNYYKDNNIQIRKQKTSVLDIFLTIINVAIPRIIPLLMKYVKPILDKSKGAKVDTNK